MALTITDMELVKEIWTVVKDMRDHMHQYERQAEKLDALLGRMKAAGMADWIPTIEDVIAAGPYFNASKAE
jgi:hypothetical protein